LKIWKYGMRVAIASALNFAPLSIRISFTDIPNTKHRYRSTVLSSFVRTRLRQNMSLDSFMSRDCDGLSVVSGIVAFAGH
jgi:hypothetical protein